MHLRVQMFQTDFFRQLCFPQSICDILECSHVLLSCKSCLFNDFFGSECMFSGTSTHIRSKHVIAGNSVVLFFVLAWQFTYICSISHLGSLVSCHACVDCSRALPRHNQVRAAMFDHFVVQHEGLSRKIGWVSYKSFSGYLSLGKIFSNCQVFWFAARWSRGGPELMLAPVWHFLESKMFAKPRPGCENALASVNVPNGRFRNV